MRAALPLLAVIALSAPAAPAAEAQKTTITSTPPGAMVFINGVYEGTAPVNKELAPGTYRVRLKRNGYRDWAGDITVPLDDPRVDIVLKALAKGSIMITSDPPECTVYVNSREEGVTPLLLKDLADDIYEVRVQKANYSTYRKTVEVAGGERVELHVRLQSRVVEYLLSQIEEKPDDLSAYAELGHQYLLEGKWDEAADIFKKGALLAGRRKAHETAARRFYQELCKVYAVQFKFTERANIRKFRDFFRPVIEFAIEHGSKRAPYYQQLVSIYSATGNSEAVMILAERMHVADPSRQVHREFGRIYLQRGMSDEAIKMFERAVRIKDGFDVRFALATAYHRRGKHAQALENYARCEKMDAPPAVRAKLFFAVARLNAQRGDHEKALAYVDRALEHAENNTWILFKINTLLDMGRCKEARRTAEQLAQSAVLTQTKNAARIMLDRVNARCKENEAKEE